VVLHFKIISTLAITVHDPVLIIGAWVQDLGVCNRLSYLEIRVSKYVITFHSTNARKEISKLTTSVNLLWNGGSTFVVHTATVDGTDYALF